MNPLYDFLDVGDLRVLMVDDSVYEILPEQLEFLQTQIATGKPLILCMHIPLYAPGRGVGFGVGHPDWNKDHDMIYKVERRPQWPEEGPSPTAYGFRNAAFSAPNMLGVLTGHIHQFFIDVIKQTPQIVVPSNSNGDYVIAEFLPAK